MTGSTALDRPRRWPFKYILLKLAARCNLKCRYCYWFRDAAVYQKPKLITPEAVAGVVHRIREHIEAHSLNEFSVLLHGGEPLLFPKPRFAHLCEDLRRLGDKLGAEIRVSVTTNGVLIDHEWALMFRHFDVRPTVSIDGPPEIHDLQRVDFGGRGTGRRVIRAVTLLRQHGVHPGFLAVAQPRTSPRAVIEFMIHELGASSFDLLLPDENHDAAPPPVDDYYVEAFDLWWDAYAPRVDIRMFVNMIRGLLGRESSTEGVGYGPVAFVTVNTDGGIEPLDVLRIRGDAANESRLNVATHPLDAVWEDDAWLEIFHASLTLPEPCRDCRFKIACGGGYLPHRWSAQSGYDNPSVYCQSLKRILAHIETRLCAHISRVEE